MPTLPRGLSAGSNGGIRCAWPGEHLDYRLYHDQEWGRPQPHDIRLYEMALAQSCLVLHNLRHPRRLAEENRIKGNISVAIDGEITTMGMLGKVDENSEVHFLPAIGGGALSVSTPVLQAAV